MHYLLFHWIWRALSLYTCALKHPAGLEKQATDDGTRCSLAPEGGAVNTPWGLSPGGTWAWELSFAQPRIIPRCQEALALCDSARCFLFSPWAGKCRKGLPCSSSSTGVDWFGPLEFLDPEGDFKNAAEAGLPLQSSTTMTNTTLYQIERAFFVSP